jgi:CheY-like chemotaxis protein
LREFLQREGGFLKRMTSSASSKQTLLLVDDNPEVFAMYRDVLPVMSGYAIVTAENGLRALETLDEMVKASAPLPVCIVIDILMPELNGVQLVRAIRGDPRTAEIPLVILTALAQEKEHFIGFASGADQYLTKPVNVADLLQAIAIAVTISDTERKRRFQHLAEHDGPDM